MAAAYSVRFLAIAGAGQVKAYTVPAGQRAVLRSVDSFNAGNAAASVWVFIAGVTLYTAPLPGYNTAAHFETRQVAYAGETVGCQTVGPSTSVVMSGYLFPDSTRAGDLVDQLEYEEHGLAPPELRAA